MKASEILEQLKAKQAAAEALLAGENFSLDAAKGLAAEIGDLQELYKQYADLDELRGGVKSLFDNLPKSERPEPTKDERKAGRVPSLGEQFLDDPEFKEWFKRVAPQGRISEKSTIVSPTVGMKTLITSASDTSGGALITPQQIPGIIPALRRPLTMRDLVTIIQTESDTVEYVKVNTETNNAATVAEATATSGSSGSKPESAFALLRVSDTIKTLAHWIPATTRALQDAPQLRGLIDNFLRFGLEEELEDQMVAGDGTGENFTGLANISGIQAQAWDTDLLTTLRKAKTKVRTVGRDVANGYLLHPNDAERLDLLQDNNGVFYFGGPANGTDVPRVWRLPIVESEAVTEGTGYVGNFRRLVLYDRMQAAIQVSNSHADFFVRNLVAILAEMRAGFGCWRPKSLVEIDLTEA